MNKEILKLVRFVKHENNQECTSYFDIEYEYKDETSYFIESRFLKFTYKNENGNIPLSGTYDELINKFISNEK
jgi:hypothetical protein